LKCSDFTQITNNDDHVFSFVLNIFINLFSHFARLPGPCLHKIMLLITIWQFLPPPTKSVLENDKNISPNQFYKMTKISLINNENNLTQKWEKLFLKVLFEIFWISIFGTYFWILKFFIQNVFLVLCLEFFFQHIFCYFSIIIIILDFLIYNIGSFGNLKNWYGGG